MTASGFLSAWDARALMANVGVHEREGADERLDQAPVRLRIQHAQGEDSVVVDWAPGSLADPRRWMLGAIGRAPS